MLCEHINDSRFLPLPVETLKLFIANAFLFIFRFRFGFRFRFCLGMKHAAPSSGGQPGCAGPGSIEKPNNSIKSEFYRE